MYYDCTQDGILSVFLICDPTFNIRGKKTKTEVLEISGRFSTCFHEPAFKPIKEKVNDHKEPNIKPTNQKTPPSLTIVISL